MTDAIKPSAESLKERYADSEQEEKTDLFDEPFIGMWRDREDMRESSEWVRNLRKRGWAVEVG